jgi:hypothetical protein
MLARTLTIASLALAALPLLAAGRTANASPTVRANTEPPGIRLWTAHGDTYRRGERVRVYFRTERDAYVTIFRVDTDGRVHILFPREPADANLAHGGDTYTVQDLDDHDAFVVDDYAGVGYVFGVASQDPFTYDAFTGNDQWSLSAVSNLADGRIHGDPHSALEELTQQMMPEGYADYDTHLLPYYVEQRYQYPRFLCYDCHAYTPYVYWNPYSHFCSRFSLFVNYDPFYFYPSYWYPTRYYGGTNVVYVRPRLAGSQYVFKAPTDQSAPSVVFRDRRGVGMQSAPADRGVRGVDLGGVGRVPAPTGGRRVAEGGAMQSGGVPAERQPIVGGTQQSGRRYAPQPATLPTTPTTGPVGKALIVDDGTGRRRAGDAPSQPAGGAGKMIAPDAKGPREIAPDAQRPRGVYIDPGMRAEPRAMPQPLQRTAPPAAVTRPEPRYIGPSAQPRAEPRSAPPAAVARPEPRYIGPQAQPRAEPRFAPQAAARPEPPRAAPRAEPRASARPESRPSPRGQSPSLVRRRP